MNPVMSTGKGSFPVLQAISKHSFFFFEQEIRRLWGGEEGRGEEDRGGERRGGEGRRGERRGEEERRGERRGEEGQGGERRVDRLLS
jgi:hypothetical protein